MASQKEQAFIAAATAAQATRQVAYVSAFNTYAPNGFGVFANLATYLAALVTADNAYYTAIASAATTNGISPSVFGSLYPGIWPTTTATVLT